MVFHKIRYLHFIAKEAVYIFFAISLLFFICIAQFIFKKHKMPHKLFSQPMRHLILAHQNRLLHISASGFHISSVFSVFFPFFAFFLIVTEFLYLVKTMVQSYVKLIFSSFARRRREKMRRLNRRRFRGYCKACVRTSQKSFPQRK